VPNFTHDFVMNFGVGGGSSNFPIFGANFAVADVVADCVIEQDGLLRNHAHHFPERVLSDLRDILTIHQNFTTLDVVEPLQNELCYFSN